jgi:hypothetical protein
MTIFQSAWLVGQKLDQRTAFEAGGDQPVGQPGNPLPSENRVEHRPEIVQAQPRSRRQFLWRPVLAGELPNLDTTIAAVGNCIMPSEVVNVRR